MEDQLKPTDTTSVEKVDLQDIDSWLAAPGADSIILPENKDEKPNIFSSDKTDISFLDEEDQEDESKNPAAVLEDLRIDTVDEDEEESQQTNSNVGRPRTDKSGLVGFLKKRIESKEMFAFDDYDESKQSLDDYLSSLSEKDIDELWEANISNMKNEVASKAPQELFENLPEELQYAAKYVADGGQDLKGLFSVLARVEEMRDLDPSEESDQESIVRSYLQATNFGDPEEIEEELTNWKDLGQLEKKAKQFKPKLDMMQEEIVQAKLAEQEMIKRQQEEAAQAYVQNVFEALRPGEIGGIKLDKKIQAYLYNGLVQPQYPSINGNPTNLLGHLLEKYQYVEPRYDLIAEALWLLSNPDDYRQHIMRNGQNQSVEKTVRQLKTEQARNRTISSVQTNEPERSPKIRRPQNIFKR